jgi:hypothetical protein
MLSSALSVGFQENLLTDNAVYTSLNAILTALNNKPKAKGLFCDVEKAVDCVSHNILLCKLEIYGITGLSKNLYSQYLKGRYQRVSLKDKLTFHDIVSNWSKIQQGVPQGCFGSSVVLIIY